MGKTQGPVLTPHTHIHTHVCTHSKEFCEIEKNIVVNMHQFSHAKVYKTAKLCPLSGDPDRRKIDVRRRFFSKELISNF